MTKKNAIIIILVSVIIIIVGLLLYYFSGNQSGQNTSTNTPAGTVDNPFGTIPSDKTNTSSQNQQTNGQNSTNTNQVSNTVSQQLRQIYASPTSGSVIFTRNKVNTIRFVDRATGNIYEARPDSEEIIRVNNTTVPKIQEAIWNSSGDSLVLRYLKDDGASIDSFSAKIKTSSSTNNSFSGEISGAFLSANSKSVVINPSGTKTFSLLEKSGGNGSYGVISNMDGSGKSTIFDSAISEWLISWPKDSIISFATKPSYKDSGYVFLYNTQNNSFYRVLGGVYGITALVNRNADALIYSESLRGGFKLNYFNIKTSEDKMLQISTMADKCVWSNTEKSVVYCAVPKSVTTSSYPDTWYQGITSFSDNFWKIDTDKGTTNIIYETGKNYDISVDAMDLRISTDDKYLVFTNKDDLSLWGLKTN